LESDIILTSNAVTTGGVIGAFSYQNGHFKSIQRSRFLGSVSGEGRVGGIVGAAHTYSKINESYNLGSVTGSGTEGTGGILGYSFGYCNTHLRNYNLGSISDSGGASNLVGGLIGHCSSNEPTNSYSAGSVTSPGGSVGGLIGLKSPSSGVGLNNFWDTTTSGQATSGGAGETGLITSEMEKESNFTNWDFIGTWTTDGDTKYPHFWWEP
jgi:hypothetical protein